MCTKVTAFIVKINANDLGSWKQKKSTITFIKGQGVDNELRSGFLQTMFPECDRKAGVEGGDHPNEIVLRQTINAFLLQQVSTSTIRSGCLGGVCVLD